MRRFNSRGDRVSGMHGDGGIVAVNGRPLLGPSAGGSMWYRDDTVITQHYGPVSPRVVIVGVNGAAQVIHVGASKERIAGGGRYAIGFSDGSYSLDGTLVKDGTYPFAFGPDGAFAAKASPSGGLLLDGVKLTDADVPPSDVTVFGKRRCLWREGFTARIYWDGGYVQASTLPVFWWLSGYLVEGSMWVVYHDDRGRVVTHPWDDIRGYVVGTLQPGDKGFWFVDGHYATGKIVIGWSATESEMPSDLRGGAVETSTPRVDLRGIPNPGPVVPNPGTPHPEPPKPPTPEPPQVPELQAPNMLKVIRAVFAAHPEIDTKNEETRGPILDHVCVGLNGPGRDKPWGRKAREKDGGNKNTDAIVYLRADGLVEIYDIIDGNTGEAMWGAPKNGPRKDGTNGWWAAAEAVVGPPTQPPPTPEPPPNEDEFRMMVLNRLESLTFEFAEIKKLAVDGFNAAEAALNGAKALNDELSKLSMESWTIEEIADELAERKLLRARGRVALNMDFEVYKP
jgi:hypothetical protein